MQHIDPLRYPIGPFQAQQDYSSNNIADLLTSFAQLPGLVAGVALRLDAMDLLDNTYRPGGWTGRQVIHHLADSHLNAYQRFKLTLTEENPTLRPYDENAWAELADKNACYFVSQTILEGIHRRLTLSLAKLQSADWQRPCFHPSNDQITKLSHLLAQYEWHGRHHLGHLKIILDANAGNDPV